MSENKETAINSIKYWLSAGFITQDDLKGLIGKDTALPATQLRPERRLNASKLLSYLGALIVVFGVILIVSQYWQALNTFARLAVTLGVSLVTLYAGKQLEKTTSYFDTSRGLYLIGGLLFATGTMVAMVEANVDFDSFAIGSAVMLFITVTYLAMERYFKSAVFSVLALISGIYLYFVSSQWLYESTDLAFSADGFYIRLLVLGSMLIGAGYWIGSKQNFRTRLKSVYWGLGGFMILGALFAMMHWEPDQREFLEILYPAFIYGGLYISTRLKSRYFLYSAGFFLFLYIVKMTVQYFSDGVGAPVALIVAGFLTLFSARLLMSFSQRIGHKRA